MNITGRNIVSILLLLGAILPVYAGNELKIVRTSNMNLEIQLNNSDKVAGIQFSLHTSSGIALQQIQWNSILLSSSWMVNSYQPNDSTMNVLIVNTQDQNIPVPLGSLGRIPFSTAEANRPYSARLQNVLITNAAADSLGVTLENLSWENTSMTTGTEQSSFTLFPNYPNPFNPSTTLNYRLTTGSQVSLSIYDMSGREISRLVDQYQNAGTYRVNWNSTGQSTRLAASGMYIARLTVGRTSTSQKMILLK